MNVEHLWHCNESDGTASAAQQHRNNGAAAASSSSSSSGKSTVAHNNSDNNAGSNHSNGGGGGTTAEGDSVSSLCSIADHRLYKIVKWCKSLPLFKNIQVKLEFIHSFSC
jgi:hypothetical protein